MDRIHRSSMPPDAVDGSSAWRPHRYLAYGSNLVSDGLARYVGEVTAVGEATEVPGWHLRFQGRSTRWQGSPAVITPDPSTRLMGRSWPLPYAQLVSVVAGEAGVDNPAAEQAVDTLLATHASHGPPEPSTHHAATVHGAISQYDTVVVLAHPGGPLWAVTSSTTDVLVQRCEPYIDQVRKGLTQLLGPNAAAAELDAALARSKLLPHDR